MVGEDDFLPGPCGQWTPVGGSRTQRILLEISTLESFSWGLGRDVQTSSLSHLCGLGGLGDPTSLVTHPAFCQWGPRGLDQHDYTPVLPPAQLGATPSSPIVSVTDAGSRLWLAVCSARTH